MKITKGFYQKNENNGYDNYTPLGTDGQLVDMISGVNLEYELKLGTKHLVSIETEDDITTIVEHYASPTEVEVTPGTKYYSLVTEIDSDPDATTTQPVGGIAVVSTVITASLYWNDKTTTPVTEKLLKVKESRIIDITVGEESYTRIEEDYREGE